MSSAELLGNGLVKKFYDEHKPWLQSWLAKKTGSIFDAADLTHDTFIKVLMKVDEVHISEPRAYLTHIAHGLMVSHFRRKDIERAFQSTLCDPFLAEYPSAEVQAITLELIMAVDSMLYGLSPKVRAAYLMLQLDGLGYAEIAERLDISVKTVGVYIAKAVFHCISFQRQE